jgi:hypothetical protein
MQNGVGGELHGSALANVRDVIYAAYYESPSSVMLNGTKDFLSCVRPPCNTYFTCGSLLQPRASYSYLGHAQTSHAS